MRKILRLFVRHNSETGEIIPGQMKHAYHSPGPEWQELSLTYCCSLPFPICTTTTSTSSSTTSTSTSSTSSTSTSSTTSTSTTTTTTTTTTIPGIFDNPFAEQFV